MFKNGFILNYYPGAKGDFLLRFISNLAHDFTATGQTPHLSQFSALRTVVYNKNIKEKQEEKAQYIISRSKVWPYVYHWLHEFPKDDLDQILLEYQDVYDIIVEPEYYLEVILNGIFKNFNCPLTDEYIMRIRREYPTFNGEYIVDKFYTIDKNVTPQFYTDEMRINYITELFNKDLDKRFTKLKNYTNAQCQSPTKKVHYSRLFKRPYRDLIEIYRKFNRKDPDIQKYESLLPKTFLPNELVYFNHKIRINTDSDTIIQVIGKVKE